MEKNLLAVKLTDRDAFVKTLSTDEDSLMALSEEIAESRDLTLDSDTTLSDLAEDTTLDLTTVERDFLHTISFVQVSLSSDWMHMQGRDPLSDVQYLNSLLETVEELEKHKETVKRFSLEIHAKYLKIIVDIRCRLMQHSLAFGGTDAVKNYCKELMENAMRTWKQ